MILLDKTSHSLHKSVLLILTFSCTLLFAGCAGDEIQLPEGELSGEIGGKPWEYGLANGFRRGSQFEFKFLSSAESVREACDLPFPGRPHVKALLSPRIGSFTVSTFAIDPNQVQVVFELGGGQAITAVDGFMEIFDISGGEVAGYLKTGTDENKVEGSFRLQLCN